MLTKAATRICSLFVGFAGVLIAASCSIKHEEGSVSRHYFGYMVVKFPRQASNREGFDVKEIRNIGLAAGRLTGVSLGYSKDKIISMPPDGRVYLEVLSDEQFMAATNLIHEFAGIGIGVSLASDATNRIISNK